MSFKFIKIYTTANEIKNVNVAQITMIDKRASKTRVSLSDGTSLETDVSVDDVFKLINNNEAL